jgi:mannose-1-phosphate guanylyltransferase/phosphomannomutase
MLQWPRQSAGALSRREHYIIIRMKAIIMAGGFGTRLRPLTVNIPKPMVPMANKPMMEHIVRLLKQNGFDDLLVMLYYQPEIIIRHFGDGAAYGVRMEYLRPQSDLGTAGCVKFAEKHLKETFLVISGDLSPAIF